MDISLFNLYLCTAWASPHEKKKLFLNTQTKRIFHILTNLYIPPKTRLIDVDCSYQSSMRIRSRKPTKRTIRWQFKSSFRTENAESRCKSTDLEQADPSEATTSKKKKQLVSIHPPLSKSHVPVDPLYQPQNMCGPTKSQMKEQVELKINLEKKKST